MAIMAITEADYETLSTACLEARDRGDIDAANALNLICRKADRALTGNTTGAQLAKALGAKNTRPRGNGPLDFEQLK